MHFHGLTPGERRVATHLLENPAQLAFLSISDLASASGTSTATIVRLVRKLAYDGFADFKRALLNEVVTTPSNELVQPHTRLASIDSPTLLAQRLMDVLSTALRDTAASLVGPAFEAAVARVAAAERVELYANRQSGHIATTSVYRFLTLGIPTTARTDALSQGHYATHLTPGDTVIVLSHAGLAANLLELIRTAKARRAPVVAITCNERSPVALAADVHLLVPLPSATLGDEEGVIRITQIAVLECLAIAAASLRRPAETPPEGTP
jgi:DNA-binding MurR/RpiR family transcriptional regulator